MGVERSGGLAGRVAVVTGGRSGIGAAVVERLRGAGAVVEVFDLAGAEPVDVTDEAAVNAAVARVVAEHGRIDVLVNNAGIFPHEPFDSMTFGQWRRVMAVDLDAVFLCTRAVYPHMTAAGYGRIVNVASAAFLVGDIDMVHYVAAKGGVVGLTRALARGAGLHGVTVNAVSPGFVETPGVLGSPAERELFDVIVSEQSVRRRGQPADIAAAVAYLVGPEASFITGQTVNVDGGHRFI